MVFFIDCTWCCIIINFINNTETGFIWKTLLNMSQGTAYHKQTLQNDLCILGKLRSAYAVRVVWSASSLKKPLVLGSHAAADMDSCKTAQRCRLIWVFAGLTYILYVLASSPQLRPASPHFNHFRPQSNKLFLSKPLSLIGCHGDWKAKCS